MEDKNLSMGLTVDSIVERVEEEHVFPTESKETKMYRIGEDIFLTISCDANEQPLKAACQRKSNILFFTQEQARVLFVACKNRIKSQNEEKNKKAKHEAEKQELERQKLDLEKKQRKIEHDRLRLQLFEKRYREK